MTNVEFKNTLFEVSEILKNIDKNLSNRIPKRLKEYIETNKSQSHNFKYDYNKSLSEQRMLKTTEKYLTMLFFNYWCTDEEKTKVLDAMKRNEEKYQKEIKEKYNPNNLFKKSNVENVKKEVALVEVKEEKWYQKILAFFRKMFRKK